MTGSETPGCKTSRRASTSLPYAEDLPPVEPVKPLTGSDLIACDYCDAKVRGDEYREHMESEHPERLRRLGEGQFVD